MREFSFNNLKNKSYYRRLSIYYAMNLNQIVSVLCDVEH